MTFTMPDFYEWQVVAVERHGGEKREIYNLRSLAAINEYADETFTNGKSSRLLEDTTEKGGRFTIYEA